MSNIDECIKLVIEKEKFCISDWQKFTDGILDSFSTFILRELQPEPIENIFIDTNRAFSRWFWSKEDSSRLLDIVCTGVIAGELIDDDSNKNYGISASIFLFDSYTKKRIVLETGESLIEFYVEQNPDNGCYVWKNCGWIEDEWGEWKGVEYE